MTVAILFDALVLLMMILGVVVGIKQGFIKMFLLRFRRLSSAVLAVFAAKPLGKLLADAFLTDKLARWIISVAELDRMVPEVNTVEQFTDALPQWLRFVWEKIFRFDVAQLSADIYEESQSVTDIVTTVVAEPVALFIAVSACWVACYLVFSLSIKMLSGLIEDVFDLPFLKQINAISGAVVGLTIHAMLVWFFCQMLGVVSQNGVIGTFLTSRGFMMEHTRIVKYIYEFNPLAFILSVHPKL